VEGRFLRLMAVGNEAAEQRDEQGSGDTAVARVFDLRDVFELGADSFDESAYAVSACPRGEGADSSWCG
jgi:hypothetical protein